MSFSVYDIRDLDLMLKLTEMTGATAGDLASEFATDENGARHIASRLAWMKRYGMLNLDHKDRLWTLSQGGERVVESKRRAGAQRHVKVLHDDDMIEVMAHVTTVYRMGDPMVAHLLRREFQYGTSPRRR